MVRGSLLLKRSDCKQAMTDAQAFWPRHASQVSEQRLQLSVIHGQIRWQLFLLLCSTRQISREFEIIQEGGLILVTVRRSWNGSLCQTQGQQNPPRCQQLSLSQWVWGFIDWDFIRPTWQCPPDTRLSVHGMDTEAPHLKNKFSQICQFCHWVFPFNCRHYQALNLEDSHQTKMYCKNILLTFPMKTLFQNYFKTSCF